MVELSFKIPRHSKAVATCEQAIMARSEQLKWCWLG
jgi:hypothetical protein